MLCRCQPGIAKNSTTAPNATRPVNRWCIRSRANPPVTPSTVQHALEKWRKEAFDFRPREFRVGEPTLASRRANAGRYWGKRQLEIRVLLGVSGGKRAPALRLGPFRPPITGIASPPCWVQSSASNLSNRRLLPRPLQRRSNRSPQIPDTPHHKKP